MSAVSDAVHTIETKLDDSGWFDDVTHQELRDISRQLVHSNLTPEQVRQVFDQLKNDGMLDKWMDEMNSGGWFGTGGLSASEKTDLFNALAGSLGGSQLAELSSHMEAGDVVELGKAVAAHANADTKLQYVQSMAEATAHGSTSGVDPLNGRSGDPDAWAVGQVLASLKGHSSAFNQAVKALVEAGGLDRVMKVAAGYTIEGHFGAVRVDYDPQLLAQIIDAATTSGNVQVKAEIFAAAAEQLKDMGAAGSGGASFPEKDSDIGQVRDAMTRLIQSDPNGIVTELRTRTDVSGGALVSYTQQMIADGKESDVRDMIIRLQQGNDGKGNAYENFSRPGVARNLGYFTGATAAAINNITSDRQAQADLIKNIFGVGYGAAGAAGPEAGIAASVGNGITAEVINGIVSDLEQGDKGLKTALYELAIPRDADGRVNQSGSGYDAFNAAYAAVAEVNR